MARPRDPFVAYRFLVEIGTDIAATFSECTGLAGETEVEEYQEGGLNEVRHRLPKTTKWTNLTLRRGLTDSKVLWDWWKARMQGDFTSDKGKRRTIGVILWDARTDNQVWRLDFYDAYPVKWTGPELKSDSNTVAVETLEFAHSGPSKGKPA
jgi:phage tail-like protein